MLLEILQKEAVAALKAKDKFRKLTLSTLIASIKKEAIDNGLRDFITNEMVLNVLKRERKKLTEAVEKFPNMPAEKQLEYSAQIDIMNEFIPREIENREQIKDIFRDISAIEDIEITQKNQGKFMKLIKLDYNVNMKVAAEVYKELLQ